MWTVHLVLCNLKAKQVIKSLCVAHRRANAPGWQKAISAWPKSFATEEGWEKGIFFSILSSLCSTYTVQGEKLPQRGGFFQTNMELVRKLTG